MSKIHSIGIQYANSSVRMYMNDPAIELRMGSEQDLSLYRLKINGDTMDCRDIAKLIIDGKIYTFTDPYIRPSYKDKGWSEEETAWKIKLGLDCFTTIQEALEPNMLEQILEAPFPKDDEVQKRKRQMEMQISKDLYEKRKEKEELERKAQEERERNEREWMEKYLADPQSQLGTAKIASNVIYANASIDTSVDREPISFSREEIRALKEMAKDNIPSINKLL